MSAIVRFVGSTALLAVFAVLFVGCVGDLPFPVRPADVPVVDARGVDAPADAPSDVAPLDAAGVDAVASDTPSADIPGADVVGTDVVGTDVIGTDVIGADTTMPTDAPSVDVLSAADVVDVRVADVTDAGPADTGTTVVDGGPAPCRTDSNCVGMTGRPRCNSAIGLCVQCIGGADCPMGMACNGLFACACPSGTTSCPTGCVDLTSDLNNCGACGVACRAGTSPTVAAEVCTSGSCAISVCLPGWADCDRSVANGCEVNTQSSPTNCGSCGRACSLPNAAAACSMGGCTIGTCAPGYGDCDGIPSNGCEVNFASSTANCGGCGVACAPAHATAACMPTGCGYSSCDTGFADCDGVRANGCEANIATSTTSCGACGRGCPTGQSCASGVCTSTCPPGTTSCGTACVNTGTDVNNCGACFNACPAGNVCNSGMCVASCPSGTTSCTSGCANTATDVSNCGACGNACPTGYVCSSGACRSSASAPSCPTGMALIPAGTFTMGDTLGIGYAVAQPIHSVTMSAFCMDLTEVTVAAYGACTTPGCSTPATGGACNWGVAGRDSHPINCVNWNQARAYCQSLGRDLPTEAQWEYAGRGTDGRIFPWGNDNPTSQICWGQTSTCAVATHPAGMSPFGLSDMSGNVFEWNLDWWSTYTSAAVSNPTGPSSPPSPAYRVYRGGGFDSPPTTLYLVTTLFRQQTDPAIGQGNLGFRCASAAPSASCPTGFTACSGACVDTRSDLGNCGLCGNVVPAGAYCVGGMISPAVPTLYHGWTSPIAGCSTTSYNATAPTNDGGSYPYNRGDSTACRAWKLAATICTTAPAPYAAGTSLPGDWSCSSGGFTDPVFGTFCLQTGQLVCSDCYSSCNAACTYNPLSLRSCTGGETSQP